jgi:aromatic ring hydroxylase
MGARTGTDYLEGLRDDREIWLDGARVSDVTRDPRLSRTASLGSNWRRPSPTNL